MKATLLTAQAIEKEYGINAKSILNRSNYPRSRKGFIPSIQLEGGKRKYFERKVINRLLQINPSN